MLPVVFSYTISAWESTYLQVLCTICSQQSHNPILINPSTSVINTVYDLKYWIIGLLVVKYF